MKNIDLQLNGHRAELQGIAYSFTKDLENANDLVQDTFLKAIRYADLYKEGTNLQAWLYTIMRNTFINDYRKRMKHNKAVDTVEDFLPHHLVKGAVNNRAGQQFIGEDINKAMNLSPNACLVPFVKYFEGYKYHEIAAELAIPIGTVKTRIHEARKSLKKNLKIYNQFD